MIANPTREQLRTLRGIIYGIRNRANDKWYVGQTINTFNERYREEAWETGVFNSHLRSSIKKYGRDAFEIVLLEHGITDIVELNRLEHHHALRLKSYDPHGYNVKPCGDGQGAATPAMKRQASINASVKEWVFKHVESGEVIRLKNLTAFAESKGLDRTRLAKVIKDGKGVYRGYGALSATPVDFVNKRIYTYRPNLRCGPYELWYRGEKHVFTDIRAFMKERGLIDATPFYDLLEGTIPAYKGYTLKQEEIVWPTRRYHEIRLVNKAGVVSVYRSVKECVEQTGTIESQLRQMIYGNRAEANGYRLVDFKHGIPKGIDTRR